MTQQSIDSFNTAVRGVALTILAGFNAHYRDFSSYSQFARLRFERADWSNERIDGNARIELYDDKVQKAIDALQLSFHLDEFDSDFWEQVKLTYIGLLYEHKQPELAETFYNSVFTRLYHRSYFNNNHIFIRPSISTQYIDESDPVFSILSVADGFTVTFRALLQHFHFSVSYQDITRDAKRLDETLSNALGENRGAFTTMRIYSLTMPFYRNKSAYIIGYLYFLDLCAIEPFVIVLRNDTDNGVYVDALLLGTEINNMFSFSWDDFMVPTNTPSSVVRFLLRMLPDKTNADLYTTMGLRKQGKNDFYRNFLQHVSHTDERFIMAPGTPGMVMTVFCSPTFPYVFKIINDRFAPQKSISHQKVKDKYQLVKHHDRAGRMADSLEFSHVAFPLSRFAPDLLSYMQEKMAGNMSIEGTMLIIHHLYVEVALTPLDVYLKSATKKEIEAIIIDYGQAIKDLIAVNIFPGDLLFKNFGVNRYNRVIFYDYDEIELVTDCNFRTIPQARYPEDEMASEPWYSVAPNDIFPEEFAFFLLADPTVKKAFMQHHADLLDAAYWKQVQAEIQSGTQPDFFVYELDKRFCNLFRK